MMMNKLMTISNIQKNPEVYEEKEEYKIIIKNLSFLINKIDDENLEKYVLPEELNKIFIN